MNFRLSLVTALAALAFAVVPASAIPTGFTITNPNPTPSYSCEGGDTQDVPNFSFSWFTGGASFGCMGSESNSSGGYVMTFLPYDGPSFHCTVTWQDEKPDCRNSVPDGGSTLALLGVALAGIVLVRRRRISGVSV